MNKNSNNPLNQTQGFTILGCDINNEKDYNKRIEACAQFALGDYIISFSTAGLNKSACISKVLVLDKELNTKFEANTVEEACDWAMQYSH